MLRWITGLIIAAFIIGCLLLLDKTWIFAIVVFLSIVTHFEFIHMVYKESLLIYKVFGMSLCGGTTYLLLFKLKTPEALLALLITLLIFSFIIHFKGSSDFSTRVKHLALFYFGFIYIGLPFYFLGSLRTLEPWKFWVFLTLGGTFLNDTGAYLVGRWFGKHKLSPQLSPGKTIEGFLGGWLFSIITALGVHYVTPPQFNYSHTIILATLIAFVGPMGDLSESLLKRSFGVKDSGNLIPGHGGLLDRVDALLFTAPVVYFYAVWII